MKIRKGIVLLVKNSKDEFLLLRQKRSGTCSFISGGLEKGDSFKDAVIREAKEEVGLEIDPDILTETKEMIRFTGFKKGPAEQKVFIYEVDSEPDLKPDNVEISGYEWCSREVATEKLKNKQPLVKAIKTNSGLRRDRKYHL